MATSSKIYNEFFEACINPPLYAAPWWLNAVCGSEGWDTVLLKNNEGEFSALIPFYKTRIRSLSSIITPPMTQWLPVITTENTNDFSIYAFLQSIPQCSILDITMKPGENPIHPEPSFRINHKYSYIIPKNVVTDTPRANYNEGLRRNLREAENNYSIENSDDIRSLLSLCHESYHQRKMDAPQWLDHIVPVLTDLLQKNQSGRIDMAFYKGEAIAGILTGWDTDSTYYLIGGRRSDESGGSAHALLLDHAIQDAGKKGLKFDFEGSMHPGIANFFQSFGAVPESYWQIRKFRGMGKLWSLFH